MKCPAIDERMELPLYGLSEAALYLRVPIKTLEYWAFGRGRVAPLISVAQKQPRALSFMNLLECHMLASMRSLYDLRLPKIRRAVAHLNNTSRFRHPLIEEPLFTNRIDLLIKEIDEFINLSRGGSLQFQRSWKPTWSASSTTRLWERSSFTLSCGREARQSPSLLSSIRDLASASPLSLAPAYPLL